MDYSNFFSIPEPTQEVDERSDSNTMWWLSDEFEKEDLVQRRLWEKQNLENYFCRNEGYTWQLNKFQRNICYFVVNKICKQKKQTIYEKRRHYLYWYHKSNLSLAYTSWITFDYWHGSVLTNFMFTQWLIRKIRTIRIYEGSFCLLLLLETKEREVQRINTWQR